jgi:hypothetical protein
MLILVFQKSISEFFIDNFLLSKSTSHPAFYVKDVISDIPILMKLRYYKLSVVISASRLVRPKLCWSNYPEAEGVTNRVSQRPGAHNK